MTFDEFMNQDDAPSLQDFAEDCGVSYTTLKSVRRGMKLDKYSVAKRISDATEGQVSIKELCE